jgi:TetR/AcrR family transcriptional regulator, mexJK operon transcriptional repressor
MGPRKPIDARRTRLRPDRIDDKISAVARNVARGSSVANACRAVGVTVPSYYRWLAQRRDRPQTSTSAARETDRIHEALLLAGKAAFLRDGFDASLEKVAASAGVGRQTVYNRFGGKNRLFAEVVQALYQRNVAPVLVLERGSNLPSMLTECGRHLLNLMLDPEAVALLRITLGEYRNHPQLATLAYSIRSSRIVPNVSGVIAKRLQEEMTLGNLDQVDPFLAAESFIGSFSAYARHRALVGLRPPSAEELERTLKFCVRIFTRGLGYRQAENNLPADLSQRT